METAKKTTGSAKSGLRALIVNCRDASRLQSLALDAKLSAPQRMGLALHLIVCKWCRRYGKQIHFLHDAAHDHSEQIVNVVPQSLSPEARERIQQRLKSEQGSGGR